MYSTIDLLISLQQEISQAITNNQIDQLMANCFDIALHIKSPILRFGQPTFDEIITVNNIYRIFLPETKEFMIFFNLTILFIMAVTAMHSIQLPATKLF